jgi:hypothetical protein
MLRATGCTGVANNTAVGASNSSNDAVGSADPTDRCKALLESRAESCMLMQ